jgi:hypothetical protein
VNRTILTLTAASVAAVLVMALVVPSAGIAGLTAAPKITTTSITTKQTVPLIQNQASSLNGLNPVMPASFVPLGEQQEYATSGNTVNMNLVAIEKIIPCLAEYQVLVYGKSGYHTMYHHQNTLHVCHTVSPAI